MRVRKVLLVLVAMLVILAGPGVIQPASAGSLAAVGAGVASASAINLPRQVTGTIKADFKSAAGVAVVSFQCEAVASPDPASTGITACSVGPIQGIPVPNNLPGAYSTAVGAGTFSYDGGPVPLCIGVTATFILDGTLSDGACGTMFIVNVDGDDVEDLITLPVP